MKWVVRLGSIAGGFVFFFVLAQLVYYYTGGEWWIPTVRSDPSAPQLLNNYVGQPPLPRELFFAGERVPLENVDVRESLDHELCVASNWHSQILLMLKRMQRYFPEFEPILRENGIPADFKYLAVAESSLNERAFSPSKAAGLWQFLEQAGKEYGLIINDEVDQRYDIVAATHAACRYLNSAYRRFGSWSMAAASYNMGQGGLQRSASVQGEKSYYDLYLNIETGRYFYRILALKLVLENPELYGFHLRSEERYKPYPYCTVQVDSTISDLAAFAKTQHTNYKMLRQLNLWLRSTKLTVEPDTHYVLRIVDNDARTIREE